MQESREEGAAGGEPAVLSGDRFRLLVESVVDYAIFMLDPDGRIASWNAGAERLKQYRADEIIGRSFEIFYPAEALAAGWPREELRRAEAYGRFMDEGWRVRKDGSTFWANVIITALRDPQGRLQGFAKVTRDLSERRLHEEKLRRSEEQFRLLLESVADYAIFMIDRSGAVLTWNSGAHAIKGYAASEVLGRHFSIFFTAQDVAAGQPEAELAAAVATGRAESRGWRVRKDGRLFWAHVIISPVYDESGVLRGFAKVTRDLSEQRRLSDLEQASRRMHEFIAMLAHELRNPLAPIRSAVAVLQAQAAPSATSEAMTAIIGRQIGHMARLVDDLLDVSRISTGKILLERRALDFHDVVALSVEAARPSAEARRHRLLVELPSAPLPMRGDATRLAQALQNLLENAVRYTPEGGEIRVEVAVSGGFATTAVSDNGIGIAGDALERIFDLFTQEHRSTSTGAPGLGIGLALGRSLVERHGGRLTAYSAGPGTGSTFQIVLPLESVPAGEADAAGAAAATPPVAPASAAAAAALRILVVDDNRDSADTMVELLGTFGHSARCAYDADQALAVAAAFEPVVVLLDLNMPGGDGFSVLERLRAMDRPPSFVAAMTGYGQPRDRERTLAAGFRAHLTKPVDPARLEALMAELARTGGAP